MKKALVIGGGIAGCSAAYFLKKKNFKIDVVEKGKTLGAGNRTSWFGGHPHTFGPRHIITKNENVYKFLDEIQPLKRLKNYKLLSYQHEEERFFHYPMNMSESMYFARDMEIKRELEEIERLQIDYSSLENFEEYWRLSVGETLYEKFIKSYSKKMWPNIENSEIDDFNWSPKGAPLRNGNFDVYPEDDGWLAAYPDTFKGYDYYFDFFTEEVNLYLNTSIDKYDTLKKNFYFNNEWHKYDVVINTISPDTLFDSEFGILPFMGRDIELIILPVETLFPEDVFMLYYPGTEKFTRIVEYKKFTGFKSRNTLIGVEYPSMNGKHYPLPIKSKQNLAKKYISLLPENFYSIGRAGSYHYSIDIDDSIQQSMDIYKVL
jgi:UDP-galactopyranose mutase